MSHIINSNVEFIKEAKYNLRVKAKPSKRFVVGHNSQIEHLLIRAEILSYVRANWNKFKNEIKVISLEKCKSADGYDAYMGLGMWGTDFEISRFMYLYDVRVKIYIKNGNKNVFDSLLEPFGTPKERPTLFLLFEGESNAGHWEFLNYVGKNVNELNEGNEVNNFTNNKKLQIGESFTICHVKERMNVVIGKKLHNKIFEVNVKERNTVLKNEVKNETLNSDRKNNVDNYTKCKGDEKKDVEEKGNNKLVLVNECMQVDAENDKIVTERGDLQMEVNEIGKKIMIEKESIDFSPYDYKEEYQEKIVSYENSRLKDFTKLQINSAKEEDIKN